MTWKAIFAGTALVAGVWGLLTWNSLAPTTPTAAQAASKKKQPAARTKARPAARRACCHKDKHKQEAKHKHAGHPSKKPATRKATTKKAHADSNARSLYQLDSTWSSHRGTSRKLSSLRGHVVMLAMIYASCPHACPMTISDIQAIDRGLTPAQRKKVRIVLVTFDPARDTPAQLKALAKQRGLDSRWILLRGSDTQILELAAVLGVKYRKVNEKDFVHSNLITILDAQGVRRHQQVGLAQDPKASQAVIRKILAGKGKTKP